MNSITKLSLMICLGVSFGCNRSDPNEEKIRKMSNIMISVARAYRAAEIFPPKTGYQDFEDAKPDLWGSYFRIEYVNRKPVLRSAGPDKTHYTEDDLVVGY